MVHKLLKAPAVTLALAVLLGGTLLSGCSAGKSTPKVLKIWHYEGGNSAMGIAWSQAMQEFEKTHPGVKIEFESKGFEQIQQTAPMILNSDQVPDVMEYNKGNATAGLISKEGLLTDLTPVVEKRGWDKILPPSLATVCKYNSDGIMGSGNWYGVTDYGEYVMVYYNKDLFDKYHVQIPTTFDQFEAAMNTFVKDGITPIAAAAAEYPAQQIFYELVLRKADEQLINTYQKINSGAVDFHGSAFTYGADTMVQWMKKGYISKEAVGMKAQDMGLAFESGKFPMMISGSWWYGSFINEIKNFKWGIFLFPGNTYDPGSGGNLWVVPAKAKNKEGAYDFIGITLSKENQTLLGNSGGIPVNADLAQITDPKAKDLIENFNVLLKQNGLAFYPDWPVPGYYNVLVSNVQDLMGGKASPSKFLDSIAKAYQQGGQ